MSELIKIRQVIQMDMHLLYTLCAKHCIKDRSYAIKTNENKAIIIFPFSALEVEKCCEMEWLLLPTVWNKKYVMLTVRPAKETWTYGFTRSFTSPVNAFFTFATMEEFIFGNPSARYTLTMKRARCRSTGTPSGNSRFLKYSIIYQDNWKTGLNTQIAIFHSPVSQLLCCNIMT